MQLQVNLPDNAYKLVIEKNRLSQVGDWVASLWDNRQIVIISDETVASLYGESVLKSIEEKGFNTSLVTVPPGEESKSLLQAEKLYHYLAEKGMTRKDGIILLGGGVVGDLGGFVASTYMRGLSFLQIPTTLLAQVDSSIGGKTAVNTSLAKNLVGSFAQPDGVLIDPMTLETLEDRRLREGLAEVVKSAAILDKELWHLLSEMADEYEALENAEAIIYACCNIKRQVVEQDEKDHGVRLLLNFGHTIGHAIEQTQGYGVVSHGEAVAIGMCQLTKVAEDKGLTQVGTLDKLVQLLETFHLPTGLENWDEEKMYQALTHDKKARGNQIKLIVLKEIGEAFIETIQIEEMTDYLSRS